MTTPREHSRIIEEFNKRELTSTFVLFIDKECSKDEKVPVCNMNCMHCYYRFADRRMKDFEELKKEIDWAIEKGADHIQITGGEPTIHPEFINLLEYIKNKEVLCSFITNGYLLSDIEFVKRISNYADYVLLSFHAGTEKTMNVVYGHTLAWKKSLKTLKNLESEKVETHINFTAMKPNYLELPELFKIIKKHKNITRLCIICFNAFCSFKSEEGQQAMPDLSVSYENLMKEITPVAENCINNNIDIAIRFFPYCKVPKHLRKYVFNFITDIFDKNEWDRELWYPKAFKKNKEKLDLISKKIQIAGTEKQKLQHVFCRFYKGFRMHFDYLKECKDCSHNLICDMPHKEQVRLFPEMKFKPFKGEIIKDASYYFNT